MLQEFLSSLNGITGNIFVIDENDCIKILNKLPFIVPSEQSLMNEVCILGTYYRRMQHFIQSYSSPLINKDNSGLYKLSLCHGLNIALKDYRNDLLIIQKELLIDPFLSVSHIKAKLNDYLILFPTLWKILDCINERKLKGGQILDVIFKNIPIGNYKIRTTLTKILNRCHHVFFRQLSAWILNGVLFDPYDEFYIEPVLELLDKKTISNNKSHPILIDNMTKPEVIALVHGSIEKQTAKSFKINERNIPCYIPLSLVNKILFIGESVHFFDRNHHTILINDWTDSNDQVNKLRNELSDKFGQQLVNLQSLDQFNLLNVQQLVESVEQYMMRRMWDLLVDENGFLDVFQTEVKDFLLLGRGELFMVFITNVDRHLINRMIGQTTESVVNNEFLKASRAVLFDKESTLNRFRFSVARSDTPCPLGWNHLSMTYSVRWPFHIVFTPDLLRGYNDISRFLIRLKRAQMRLNGLYLIKKLRNRSLVRQWQLRNHMCFLVNHLQYYLQVDVIESEVSVFEALVREHRDVETLKAGHERFVSILRAHMFRFNATIESGLDHICEAVIEYASLMEESSQLNTHGSEPVTTRLVYLQERFHSLSITLYNILSNVEGHTAANPHLRQLLVILDFNSFFSVLGAQIGSLKKSTVANIRKHTV